MSGTYFNPLDSAVLTPHPDPLSKLYSVGIEGTDQVLAYFVHKDDADLFADTGYCYPYKKAFVSLVVKEPKQ